MISGDLIVARGISQIIAVKRIVVAEPVSNCRFNEGRIYHCRCLPLSPVLRIRCAACQIGTRTINVVVAVSIADQIIAIIDC